MTLSKNKEDYLKAMFHLVCTDVNGKAATKELAEYMDVSPASVNYMLKKLRAAGLVDFEKYGKAELTGTGRKLAVRLIRKHRLWETFLYDKLGFTWDEVHEVAEQLEHIRSEKLIDRLDVYLGCPSTDPHGDVIPDADGKFENREKVALSEMEVGKTCRLIAVDDSSSELLQHVSKIGLTLNCKFKVIEKQPFDASLLLDISGRQVWVSGKFADSVYVI